MSLSTLAQGTLMADPQKRTSAASKTFVTGSMRVPTQDDPILVSMIAFGPEPTAALESV